MSWIVLDPAIEESPITDRFAPATRFPPALIFPVAVMKPVFEMPARVEVAEFAVREPPTLTFPEVVIKPVFEMPDWVDVPDTERIPDITALFVIYIERSARSPPLKVEVAVVEVA